MEVEEPKHKSVGQVAGTSCNVIHARMTSVADLHILALSVEDQQDIVIFFLYSHITEGLVGAKRGHNLGLGGRHVEESKVQFCGMAC